MMLTSAVLIIVSVLQFCAVVSNAQSTCKNCESVQPSAVCGVDGATYRSRCDLERIGCKEGRVNHVDCERKCPCDPPEVTRMDNETVQALAKLRREILEAGNQEEEIHYSNNDDAFDNTVLGVVNREPVYLQDKAQWSKWQSYLQNKCPDGEMAELPRRLIDWFHVLKSNERDQKYKREGGTTKQAPLRPMKYIDAKLKAMYSKLACADNDDIVESKVCLSSVQWMFHQLDSDGDKILSPLELYEIEEISNEHCIKPFLRRCDRDQDKNVRLAEFCKCLCLTPPCSSVVDDIPSVFSSGRWKPFPGYFTPKCDEDGFFMPNQKNARFNEFWCVDRNGNEVEGTRGSTRPECDINTRWQQNYKKIIPLDLFKENAPIKPKIQQKQ